MNAAATTLLVLTAAAALANWWSRAASHRGVEMVTKPLTMLLLIAVALTIDAPSPTVRAWFVAALLASLLGDVFLMLPRERFLAGLASFLLAHLAYTAGLSVAGFDIAAAVAGAGVALIGVASVGMRILGGAAARARLRQPVAAYIAVISAMLVAAVATRNVWAMTGAALFYASDATLGWNRFVAPLSAGPVLIMVTYHGGQALLVISLLSL